MKNIIYLFIATFLTISCVDKNKDYLVNIHTDYGTMKVLLYDETPLHKKNFLQLAKSGRFDSTIFHRIIKGFMIQGGDIYEKERTQEPDSNRIPAEIVKGFVHTKGALAAARIGDGQNPEKKSSSCQFYIVDGASWDLMTIDMQLLNQKISILLQDPAYQTLREEFVQLSSKRDIKGMNELALKNLKLVEDKFEIRLQKTLNTTNNEEYKKLGGAPHLDGEYTVFGKIVEGLEVIDKIASVNTNPQDRPLKPIYMKMEVVSMRKKDVTAQYNYEYLKERKQD